jgi:DNA-binding IclR family transcriptional regulator
MRYWSLACHLEDADEFKVKCRHFSVVSHWRWVGAPVATLKADKLFDETTLRNLGMRHPNAGPQTRLRKAAPSGTHPLKDRPSTRNPLSKSYTLLRWMTEANGIDWGLREIAKGVNMHPSTVHRVISMLEDENLVRQDPLTGRYALGLEFMRLAWRAARRRTLADAAEKCLRKLTEETNETALLGIYDRTRRQMMYISMVESAQPIRHVMELHQWLPVHAGATGLALLAFQPEEEQKAVLIGSLPALTKLTITDPNALKQMLAQVRKKGYAVGRGERVQGAAGVAAPILDSGGSVLGVVGIGMPVQRLRESDQDHLAELVKQAAACIAGEFGAASLTTKRDEA